MTLHVESPQSSSPPVPDTPHPADGGWEKRRRVALAFPFRPPSVVGRTPGFDALIASALGLATFALYVLTLAPTVLRSDSGEFHVVPWVLGIAHPPGYPLLTLLGRLVMFLPLGDPAYRVNLLDAAAAAAAASLVYLTVVELIRGRKAEGRGQEASALCPGGVRLRRTGVSALSARLGGLAAAAALGLGATYWQQSVVGGPRPFVFFFTALLLWLLFRWGRQRRTRDLVLLAVASGLALTHHTNQVLLFPGLAIYLLGRDPGLLRRPKQLLAAGGAFLLPLLLYLYLPVRSSMDPPLGALDLTNLRDLSIYLTAGNYQNSVLANCASEPASLQARRYLVFLLLQFGPLLSLAAGLGAVMALARAPLAGVAMLYAFLSNAGFGICSTLAMPDYIVPSFVVAAIWIGLALAYPLSLRLGRSATWPAWLSARANLRLGATALALGLVVGLVAYRLVTGLPAQSMVGRTLDAERARSGMAQAEPRVLVLSDWESVTPLWYAQYVQGLGRRTHTAIVTAPPGSDTWLIETEKGLEDGRVSLAQRVPALGEKYRLFPIGSLYDVTERVVVDRGPNQGLQSDDRALRLLGYRLDRPVAGPGELLHLTLYQKADRGREVSYQPVLRLESDPPVEFAFGSQLHYPPASWADGEVVGEVYEFSVPSWAPAGELPLDLAYRVEGRDSVVGLAGGHPWLRLGSLQVAPPRGPNLAAPPEALASFANQLALRGGVAASGASRADLAAGPGGLSPRPGGALDLELRWSGLRWMDESYTLFVHLLDGHRRLVAQQDALPLGGIFHTYKWVPGQVMTDWYRLLLPPDLPPGEYWLEIGAYQSATTQRLPLVNSQGGSDGATFLWGPLRID